jgi:hypothetical protein
MTASLRALLSGIIDYAGMFPPASLSMYDAVHNYARYRQSPESWMLGRFICPASRLQELRPFLDVLLETGPAAPVSVLAGGGKDYEGFLSKLHADLNDIGEFKQQCAQQARVEMLELRIPTDVIQGQQTAEVHDLKVEVTEGMKRLGLPAGYPYFEAELGPQWGMELNAVCEGLHLERFILGARNLSGPREGFKLRCGGIKGSLFPSSAQVAATIITCRDRHLALKFTAGLHYPIRRFDDAMQCHIHGFLNVFGAGVLAHARGLTEEHILLIIQDEDPGSFLFDDVDFQWKDLRATRAEIQAARRHAVTSFGSCSFEEPCEHLRALGLLP